MDRYTSGCETIVAHATDSDCGFVRRNDATTVDEDRVCLLLLLLLRQGLSRRLGYNVTSDRRLPVPGGSPAQFVR